jgi:hypothetical protein
VYICPSTHPSAGLGQLYSLHYRIEYRLYIIYLSAAGYLRYFRPIHSAAEAAAAAAGSFSTSQPASQPARPRYGTGVGMPTSSAGSTYLCTPGVHRASLPGYLDTDEHHRQREHSCGGVQLHAACIRLPPPPPAFLFRSLAIIVITIIVTVVVVVVIIITV